MENVLLLLTSAVEEKSDQCLKKYLDSCSERRAFFLKDSSIGPIVGTVNALLNERATRPKGLVLLRELVPQCNHEVLTEHAVSWLQECVRAAAQHTNSTVDALAFKTSETLLCQTAEITALRRNLVTLVVPRLIEVFVSRGPNEISLAYLQCLAVFLRHYGSSCGSVKAQLETVVLGLVEEEGQQLAASAQCYALLAQVGGSGTAGVLYKAAWRQRQGALLYAMHALLDTLLDNVNEIQLASMNQLPVGDKKLAIRPVNETNPLVKAQRLAGQFVGLSCYLQAMLLGCFPVSKAVTPEAVVGIACRGLAISCLSIAGRPGSDMAALTGVLPQLHVALLRSIEALIRCCRLNLVPFASQICGFAAQTLKWTCAKDWPNAQCKPYRSLRAAAYDLLCCWLTVARAASRVETVAEELIAAILSDVRPQEGRIMLQVSTLSSSRGGKQRDWGQGAGGASGGGVLADRLANRELCLGGLAALQAIWRSAAPMLTTQAHKMVHQTMVRLLAAVQQAAESDGGTVPYVADASCRAGLYTALVTLCLAHHPRLAPPIACALAMLRRGLSDSSMQVSQACAVGLSLLEKIIHPPYASLSFPLVDDSSIMAVEAEVQHEICGSTSQGLKVISDERYAVSPQIDLQDDISTDVDSSDKETGKGIKKRGKTKKRRLEDMTNDMDESTDVETSGSETRLDWVGTKLSGSGSKLVDPAAEDEAKEDSRDNGQLELVNLSSGESVSSKQSEVVELMVCHVNKVVSRGDDEASNASLETVIVEPPIKRMRSLEVPDVAEVSSTVEELGTRLAEENEKGVEGSEKVMEMSKVPSDEYDMLMTFVDEV